MIRKSKWIEIHSPDESVAAVAARTLDGRLRLVSHYLALAAAAADDDDEHVHQTRVATRRAMTTLAIFEYLLPRNEANWFRKRLKQARKAANDARDYDVLADRLSQRLEESGEDRTCEELIGWIHDRRRESQKPVREIAARFDKKRYNRRAKRLVKKLLKADEKEHTSGRFGQLAQARMRALADDFFGYAPAELRDLEKLHEFRVCGKNLRYAMEVFAGAFPYDFRDELYPRVEALQEQLGKINDHAMARSHYERWLGDSKDEAQRALLSVLIDDEAAAINRLHDQFLQEWTDEQAATLRRRFLRVVGGDSPAPAVAAG